MADESAKSLATCVDSNVVLDRWAVFVFCFPPSRVRAASQNVAQHERSGGAPREEGEEETYLGNAADVFIAVLFGEA